jgi:hypothetical protein
MYGEVRINVNNEYYYSSILNIDYELIGGYLPEIKNPIEQCREAEYPELQVKYLVIENIEDIDYNEVIEVEITSLDLDIEPFTYLGVYDLDSWVIKKTVTILGVS